MNQFVKLRPYGKALWEQEKEIVTVDQYDENMNTCAFTKQDGIGCFVSMADKHLIPLGLVRITEAGKARAVNDATNPKMGIRHINYESMLRELDWNMDSKFRTKTPVSMASGMPEFWYALIDQETYVLVEPK